MNVINVKIDFVKGICHKQGISVVTGDYNSTKVVFEFNEEANSGTKMFKMKNPSGELVYADQIVNNEVILVGYEEDNGETTTYSLFGEEGDYTFEVAWYKDNGRITSVCDYITATKEQVIVDGEVVEERITLFDSLLNTVTEKIEQVNTAIQEVNQAITETNNLNIDIVKPDRVATVTLTKKNGTTKTVDIRDGYDLEYDWNGTELGVKREDEPDYEYVELKGEKGDCYFATFEIIDGRLKMNKPASLSQINFMLSNNGHLEMEVMI